MKVETYRRKLQKFFRKIEEEGAEPTEWYINNVFNKEDDEFIKLVICYVFFHHQKDNKRTYVYINQIKEIIRRKKLKL